MKDDTVQRWASQHCSDELLRSELTRAALLNMHDQTALVMPAERFLFGFFEQAYVEAMTSVPPTVDIPYWLRHKGIYICIGGGSVDAIKTVMGTDFQQIIFDAKESHCDVLRYVYMDEVTNYGLLQRMEAEALATVRYTGVNCRFAVQEYDFADGETGRKFRQNTSSIIFRQGSPDMAEECARDLIALTDEYKVHHTDRAVRQLHGGYREEKRESRGTWQSGDKKADSVQRGTQLVSEY